jgi:hypothetical protein
MLAIGTETVAGCAPVERANAIYRSFIDRIPYENLSNNRAVRESPEDPDNWPRATDRLLRENSELGLGGTSFSMAYALRDLFRGAGLAAHTTLGYNLVTEQAHAAVILYADVGPLLYDPAMLMSGPVPVRPGGILSDPLGEICLEPRCGPTLTVTIKMSCGARPSPCGPMLPGDEIWHAPADARGLRPVYSIIPVPAPPQSFRQAWLASFYRGRAMPLRLARRRGDEIVRYGERPGSLEILRVGDREERKLGNDPAGELHEVFGIDQACLQAWFERSR